MKTKTKGKIVSGIGLLTGLLIISASSLYGIEHPISWLAMLVRMIGVIFGIILAGSSGEAFVEFMLSKNEEDGEAFEDRPLVWCRDCKSYHVEPRNRREWEVLQCFADFLSVESQYGKKGGRK